MNLVNCKSCNISPTGSVISGPSFIAYYIFSLCNVIFCFDSKTDNIWTDFVDMLKAVIMPIDCSSSGPQMYL